MRDRGEGATGAGGGLIARRQAAADFAAGAAQRALASEAFAAKLRILRCENAGRAAVSEAALALRVAGGDLRGDGGGGRIEDPVDALKCAASVEDTRRVITELCLDAVRRLTGAGAAAVVWGEGGVTPPSCVCRCAIDRRARRCCWRRLAATSMHHGRRGRCCGGSP